MVSPHHTPHEASSSTPSTPPRKDNLTTRAPTPASGSPHTPSGAGYPPIATSPPSTPQQQARQHSGSSPSTYIRAINTALPYSPHQGLAYSTPPSSFPARLAEAVELTPIRSSARANESPFHDRHSIAAEDIPQVLSDEDPFEFHSTRQKTMPGYQFSKSPTHSEFKRELSFGGIQPVSEARRSLYPPTQIPIPTADPDLPSELASRPTLPPIKPTFRGMFALFQAKDYLYNVIPAVLLTVVTALIAPYMSMLLGEAFGVFARYPSDTFSATSADRTAFSAGVKRVVIKLALAGTIAVTAQYLKAVAWYRIGEVAANRLREAVYEGVQRKPMEWFDLGMNMKPGKDLAASAVGAGGLMAKFTRETDDVRTGMSGTMGYALQGFLTFLFCFILAMIRSPVLALVTLSTIPLVVLVQIATQVICEPLYGHERRAFAEASTNVDRATTAIATVKAHNAQAAELTRFSGMANRARDSLQIQATVWGLNMAFSDFFLLGTFVLGLWYAARSVSQGKASSETVITVFWAALLAASNLQVMVPQLSFVTKGKMSMASLMSVIQEPASPSEISFPIGRPRSYIEPRPSRPPRCHGEFTLQHISFAYPSRPNDFVLTDVSLFLPPGETTFIVGGSGSGKSTIAQILLRLYQPSGGEITMDDQSFSFLDEQYLRENIAAVQQGCILFDMSIHDNVAIGLAGAGPNSKTGIKRTPKDVTREEVVEACRMAMIHDFIASLPEGYETMLGTGGNDLSGGQKQRLAIARARIRDPTVLFLDEATSALDATSRVQVFENLKKWRRNRTTVVITHDLSQIVPDDFVYVMKDDIVAEQGFRSDLMKRSPMSGVFAAMAAEQAIQPMPMKVEDWVGGESMEVMDEYESVDRSRRGSLYPGIRPGSEIYLDILDEYSGSLAEAGIRDSRRMSKQMSFGNRLSWVKDPAVPMSRPTSRMSRHSYENSFDSVKGRIALGQDKEMAQLRYSYRQRTMSQNLEDDLKGSVLDIAVRTPAVDEPRQVFGLFQLIRKFFPTVPRKYLLVIGIISAIAHGAVTPIWSTYIAKLMVIIGSGGKSASLTTYTLTVLALCAAQGLATFAQEHCLNYLAARWTASIRATSFQHVLAQDKSFFDESQNAPARLVQCLIKDADDMRSLMGMVIGKMVVVVVMFTLGLTWAMVVQWRLTLVGMGLIPVFGVVMVMNVAVIERMEVVNKAKREALARSFYQSVSNIRGIRSMALDSTFQEVFRTDALAAKRTGKKASWIVGISLGLTSGLPLFAQCLLFWTSGQFMLKNYMNYGQMLQACNLIIFSLTFGSAMLDFIPIIAKAKVAGSHFYRLCSLPFATAESSGDLRFPITGKVTFDNISFAYPSRPNVPIFTNLSLQLNPGECVAIVGPSGCGKSTIAALLQRLYEPTSGQIRMDKHPLAKADTKWLRNHIAVVSQFANLFDATICENIAYGSEVPIGEIHRAAKSAAIHEFITSLPAGYETNVGENASLISGGQAQRIQIARALVRRSNILVLDECTSALDVDNARAILDTIVKIKDTTTTVFITHSVEAMKRCDRIICLGEGKVAETGSYEELKRRGGVFAQLMRTGEWE